MKICFDKQEKDYIEISKTNDGNISIIISAKDINNSKNTIVNACTLTEEQFKSLVSSLL